MPPPSAASCQPQPSRRGYTITICTTISHCSGSSTLQQPGSQAPPERPLCPLHTTQHHAICLHHHPLPWQRSWASSSQLQSAAALGQLDQAGDLVKPDQVAGPGAGLRAAGSLGQQHHLACRAGHHAPACLLLGDQLQAQGGGSSGEARAQAWQCEKSLMGRAAGAAVPYSLVRRCRRVATRLLTPARHSSANTLGCCASHPQQSATTHSSSTNSSSSSSSAPPAAPASLPPA
jgi:hypothetical protein